jgi:hypothetical protein
MAAKSEDVDAYTALGLFRADLEDNGIDTRSLQVHLAPEDYRKLLQTYSRKVTIKPVHGSAAIELNGVTILQRQDMLS